MFMVHLATHKDKKALLSLRKNGMDIASIINQDGKNKGNHMMGQCVLMELDQGDEVRSSWSLETNSIIFLGLCLHIHWHLDRGLAPHTLHTVCW